MDWKSYYAGKIDALYAVIDDLDDLYKNTGKSNNDIKILIDSYLNFIVYCERQGKPYER